MTVKELIRELKKYPEDAWVSPWVFGEVSDHGVNADILKMFLEDDGDGTQNLIVHLGIEYEIDL